jgi:hypothetical protein
MTGDQSRGKRSLQRCQLGQHGSYSFLWNERRIGQDHFFNTHCFISGHLRRVLSIQNSRQAEQGRRSAARASVSIRFADLLAVDAQGGSVQAQNAAGFAHLRNIFDSVPFHCLPARSHQAFDC